VIVYLLVYQVAERAYPQYIDEILKWYEIRNDNQIIKNHEDHSNCNGCGLHVNLDELYYL
jgi:hypothetical protein